MTLRAAILADSPTGYWPLDVNNHDASGNGYDATSGGPQYGYGSAGSLLSGASAASEFGDGAVSRMVLPAALLDPFTKFTYEFVFVPLGGNSSVPNGTASVMGMTDASQQRDTLLVDPSTGGHNIQINLANTSSNQSGYSAPLIMETVHHVVVIMDWTVPSLKFVIDGIETDAVPNLAARNHGGSVLYVGADPDSWWGHLHMKISDVAIWSGVALPVARAKAHYWAADPAAAPNTALGDLEGLVVFDDFSIPSPSWGVGATLAPARTGHVWTIPTQSKDALIRFGTGSGELGLANANLTPGQEICVVDTGVADCDIYGDIHLSPNRADAGLVFRVTDDDNYIVLAVAYAQTDHNVSLWKRDAGTFTEIAGPVDMAGVFSLGSLVRVHARLRGPRLLIYINDALAMDYTLTTGEQAKYLTPTVHGYRVNYNSVRDDAVSGLAQFAVLHPSGSFGTVY